MNEVVVLIVVAFLSTAHSVTSAPLSKANRLNICKCSLIRLRGAERFWGWHSEIDWSSTEKKIACSPTRGTCAMSCLVKWKLISNRPKRQLIKLPLAREKKNSHQLDSFPSFVNHTDGLQWMGMGSTRRKSCSNPEKLIESILLPELTVKVRRWSTHKAAHNGLKISKYSAVCATNGFSVVVQTLPMCSESVLCVRTIVETVVALIRL